MQNQTVRTVQFFDQEFGQPNTGHRVKQSQLKLAAATLTAAEVIASRVKAEWSVLQSRDEEKPACRAELVERLACETGISTFSDLDSAVKAAHRAFKQNQYIFFWNDSQVAALDERLDVLSENDALFFRITPLKGG